MLFENFRFLGPPPSHSSPFHVFRSPLIRPRCLLPLITCHRGVQDMPPPPPHTYAGKNYAGNLKTRLTFRGERVIS